MNVDVLNEDDKFQPYLLKNHYSFVGPANESSLENFIKVTNEIAPVISFSRSIHDILSNRTATRLALKHLPPDTPLRVYVVIRADKQILIHASIEEYCERFKINYPAV